MFHLTKDEQCMIDALLISWLIILAGKQLDLTIYIIINKTCAALWPHKYMSDPLGPPKNLCSLWLN